MIQAVNDFVIVLRDEPEDNIGGLYIPETGKEKPHKGKVISVGELVEDKNIQPEKSILFHKGVGFHVEHEGIEYLVLEGERVIAIV